MDKYLQAHMKNALRGFSFDAPWFIKALMWIVFTLQYRSLRAYGIYMVGQKEVTSAGRRQVARPFAYRIWLSYFRLKHKWMTSSYPEEIPEMYEQVFDHIMGNSGDVVDPEVEIAGHALRLGGSTLVINERYAINPFRDGGGVYVHEMINGNWERIYRTHWQLSNIAFIGDLSTIYAAILPPALGSKARVGYFGWESFSNNAPFNSAGSALPKGNGQ